MPDRCRHTIFLPQIDAHPGRIVLEGDEARHAVRVKRVAAGQRVAVVDGHGRRVVCEVAEAGRTLTLSALEDEIVPRPRPDIEVFSATPKGPRAGNLVDLVSQAGADSWTPLETAFGVESVRENRRERLERVAVESLKQCGRAHVLEIGDSATIGAACEIGSDTQLVIADAGGERYEAAPGAQRVRVLIGPEGGWREDELAGALDRGAVACRFGPHVMRIETAACAAVAIIRDAWERERGAGVLP